MTPNIAPSHKESHGDHWNTKSSQEWLLSYYWHEEVSSKSSCETILEPSQLVLWYPMFTFLQVYFRLCWNVRVMCQPVNELISKNMWMSFQYICEWILPLSFVPKWVQVHLQSFCRRAWRVSWWRQDESLCQRFSTLLQLSTCPQTVLHSYYLYYYNYYYRL